MKLKLYLFLLLFLSAATLNAQTYTLDWGSSFGTWTAGAISGSATNVGGSGRNVTANFTITAGSVYNTGYPAVNVDNSSATLFQVQGSTDAIMVVIDLDVRTSASTLTLNFTAPVQNVNFSVADIDRIAGAGPVFTYMDSIIVTGTGPTGTVIPTLTKYNASSTITNIAANAAVANAGTGGGNVTSTAQGSPAQDGTVIYSFTGNAITSITLRYGTSVSANVQTNPDAEAVAIGNVLFDNAVAPVVSTITNPVLANTLPAVDILDPTGTDDESIASYTIVTLPSAAAGTLTYFNGTAYVAVTASLVLTPAQAASIRFDPLPTFTGTASFTFTATDNRGLTSNTGTFNLPVEPVSPPTAYNIVAPLQNSSQATTPIPALVADVPSGSITNYTVTTIPTAAQGILYLCNPTCAAVTAGQTLTPAQAAQLSFDPAPGFTGNATFNYTAVANGATSNTAVYTIPVRNEPPVANTIFAQVIRNNVGQTPIPSLLGADADGTVASYTISTIPSVSEGILYLCTPTCTPVAPGATITLAQASQLQFAPAAGYVGTARFNYTATDNNGLVSPAAAYNIPVKGAPSVNIAPYADNLVSPPMSNTLAATTIPTLAGYDADGTIASYTIETLPTAAQGVLFLCNPTCVAVTAGQSLTPAQAALLRFDPAATFTGTASFTYSATDNSGNKSNNATFSIPVTNRPPVANPVTTPVMSNTYAATAIPALSGTDDGSITQYTITSIPTAAQGVLSLCNPTCVAVTAGQVITPAQAALLSFDPAAGFTGNATFNYTSTDNNSQTSQPAVYTIPVTGGTLPAGLPPVANSIVNTSMPNTNATTTISALSGSDPDGTVASYVIGTLPPATAGILYLCNPTCVAVTAGQVLTPAQAALLSFDPAAGFEGSAVFTYTAVDNLGKLSNVARFTIPVTATPPVARNVSATPMNVTAATTPIAALSGTDADGTIASYTITSIPPANTGILYLCNPTCTAVTAGQVLTPAQAAQLSFDPAGTFTGVYSQFNYITTDNSGNTSNTATYTLPLYLGNPLPVTLLSFGVNAANDIAYVKWSVENEINFSKYIVERSTDGISFSAAGEVAAQHGTGVLNYEYPDDISAVSAQVIYYRLKMVDIDGRYEYSDVASVRKNGTFARTVVITPNPTSTAAKARIRTDVAGPAEIVITNMLGEQVSRTRVSLFTGENIVPLTDAARLSNGVYVVRVIMDTDVMVTRFVKQ